MQVLIIEDESLAAERLEGLLADVAPELRVIAKLGSIKESVRWLSQNEADLIFLDIQLSDGLSFKIFEQVEVSTPVIFTTAYDQYAIKAFELNSIAYLLKPIRKTELQESLGKYRNLRSAFSIDFESLIHSLQEKQKEYRKRFLVQFGERIKKIEVSDIAYFFAMDKNVFITTFDDHSYPADSSLDKLEPELDPSKFFRINRKYIINMEAISGMVAYSRGRIKLDLKPAPDEKEPIVVSIERCPDFKNWLDR